MTATVRIDGLDTLYASDQQADREARAILATRERGATALVDRGSYHVLLAHLGGGRVRQTGARRPGRLV